MATYNDLIQKVRKQAEGRIDRVLLAKVTVQALEMLAPTKPYGTEMCRELLNENDIGELQSGCPDLDAPAPDGLLRIVWNSCNLALRAAAGNTSPRSKQ